jgi:hypothetical protein
VQLNKLIFLLTIDLYRLDKKIVSKENIPAQITAMNSANAILCLEQELKVLDNVRIHLYQNNNCEQAAQIYAKVGNVDLSEDNI